MALSKMNMKTKTKEMTPNICQFVKSMVYYYTFDITKLNITS